MAHPAGGGIVAPLPIDPKVTTLNLGAMGLSGSSKVAIVTGGHTGVGMSIANNLAALGYHVVIASRNEGKAQAAMKTICTMITPHRDLTFIADRMNGIAKLTFLSLNLGSKKSVHEFVEQFKKRFDKLNLLVLNASIITEAKETTDDGLENTLQWNALSHYLMCVLFTDLMKSRYRHCLALLTDSFSEDPRIIHVASSYAGELDLNDLQFDKRAFNGGSAYAQSKQANRMLSKYLAMHYQTNGIQITSNACHAGVSERQRREIMESPRNNVPPSPRPGIGPSPRVDTPIPLSLSSSGGAIPPPSPTHVPPPSPGSGTGLTLPLGFIDRPTSPGLSGSMSVPTPRNEPCRYYLQGNCLRGDRCQYLHIAPETLTPEEVEKYKPTPSPRGASAGTGTHVSPRAKAPVPATPSNTAMALAAAAAAASIPRPASPLPTPEPSPQAVSSANAPLSPTAKQAPSPRDTPYWATSLEQVAGNIVKTAKDQNGCRFLQKLLDEKAPNAMETIYAEALPAYGELMSEPFGNYLCQKLMEIANEKQRTDLVERICANLHPVSLSMQGARALWKLMDLLSPAQIHQIREALRPLLLTLALDINGNVVVQKCVTKFAPDNQYIFDAFAARCVDVATNRHGCYLFQRCVDNGSAEQKQQLAYAVIENSVVLMKDAYGNYVVQYILDQSISNVVPRLAKKLAGFYTELSTGKFSSNVVEKLLKLADQSVLSEILKEIGKKENLTVLVPDQYANYVVQTAIVLCEPEHFKIFVALLHPHLMAVRNTPHGKRIHNKILKTQLLHDLTNDACAETPTFLATSPAVKGVSGKYFDLRLMVADPLSEDQANIAALVTHVHRLMGLPEPTPLP